MNDLISRKDALSLLNVFTEKDALGSTPAEIIKHMPSVDPVVHGHWIDMGDVEQCSSCKGTRLKEFNSFYGNVTWIRTAYCPHCGAKMDEVTHIQPNVNRVVRCKDCMWMEENYDPDHLYCKLWKHFVTGKWFCADGEMIGK